MTKETCKRKKLENSKIEENTVKKDKELVNVTDACQSTTNVAISKNDNDKINEEVKKLSRQLQQKYCEDTKIKLNNIVTNDDFTKIYNRCCENILGYAKIPLGMTKEPIKINNQSFYVPICTTEGALVASLCRGAKLVNACNGIKGIVENLGITRSFAIEFTNFSEATAFYKWLRSNEEMLKEVGNSTSNYLKVKSVKSKHVIGRLVYIKVHAYTGDAMGMNMITKACNQIAKKIVESNTGSKLSCISANTCVDKKNSAENFCNGRGRKVSLNLEIPDDLCKQILKVSIHDLIKVHHSKIVLGSALSMSSMNCQAANYVSAIYIACGQDVAHIIESSNCLLDMEICNNVLLVSLYMPSIVCGVHGGGTHLEPQANFLEQFYQSDSDSFITDRNLDKAVAPNWFALTVASSVLCGELSCMAALCDNTLMDAHLKLNRKNNL